MKLVVAALLIGILYLLQKRVYKKYWNKNLTCDLEFDRDYMECGDHGVLLETVTNDKFLPLPVFHLKFSVDRSFHFLDMVNASVTDNYHKNEAFTLPGHTKVTRKLDFEATKRGVYEITNATVLVKDFFLSTTFADSISRKDSIYVFPEKIDSSNFKVLFQGLMGEMEARRSIVDDELTFRGLRSYQPFDCYRSINWKQSAKARNLMVNLYGYSMNTEVELLLNLDTDSMIETNALLEESISIVSSLCRAFLLKKVSVGLMTNGLGREEKLLPAIGAGGELAHARTIDQQLAEIKSSSGKDSFLKLLDEKVKKPDVSKLYLLVSAYHKPDLLERMDSLKKAGCGVQMIVPYYDAFPYKAEREYIQGWEVILGA